ncbi:MAG: hypothetical protein P8P98_05500 [Emcibacteraceae bacterium]|nr:hypothetical protein [Emcibacteraceae bacterium]
MLVVITGIFVGLQISNLNEERKNVLKGESYLNRIADELEQDISFFDTTLRVNENSVADGKFLLSTLNDQNQALENPTRFIHAIERLGSTLKINVSDNTFEEIKFSGNLDLIRNEPLRNKIADYYDFIEMERNWSHVRILMETTYFERNVGIIGADQWGRYDQNNEEVFTSEEAKEVYDKFILNISLIEWIPVVINTKKQNLFFDRMAQTRAKELLEEIRTN